jgi:hypothetical protein
MKTVKVKNLSLYILIVIQLITVGLRNYEVISKTVAGPIMITVLIALILHIIIFRNVKK